MTVTVSWADGEKMDKTLCPTMGFTIVDIDLAYEKRSWWLKITYGKIGAEKDIEQQTCGTIFLRETDSSVTSSSTK